MIMLYVQTIVNIVDNSGGFFGLCIRILGKRNRALIGDALSISIKSIFLNKKIKFRRKRKIIKGAVQRAIVIRVAYQKKRAFNIFFKGTSNAVAILGAWGMPMASRVAGPIHYEIRISKYPKFSSLSEGAI